MRMCRALLISAPLIALATSACYYGPPPAPAAQTRVDYTAPAAPPPPQAETIPPAPSPTSVWIPGRWQWTGATWAWQTGHYADRPQAMAAWVPGHWEQSGNQWVWVEGGWR